MKKIYTVFISFVIVLFLFAGSDAFAQGGTVITMTTPGGKIQKDSKKKIAEFTIKGLNTQEEVNQFVKKALAYPSVISFDVSLQVINGERLCRATFALSIEKGYFKELLTHLGVTAVVIDGKETAVADLGNK